MGLDIIVRATKKTNVTLNNEERALKEIEKLLKERINRRIFDVSILRQDNKKPMINIRCKDEEYEEIADWRKINFVFGWVQSHVQEIENCVEVILEREDLEDLMKDCAKVLNNKELAKEIIPTESGFFFGSAAYDDYYFEDVKTVKEDIEAILNKYPDDNLTEFTIEFWW